MCRSSAAEAAAPQVSRPGGNLTLQVLSNRADLVSGGDALVQVGLPPGVAPGSVAIDLNGGSVKKLFAVRANGAFQGLVTGLKLGDNVLSARAGDGYGARITIRNHPVGGPVFSGPQVNPWICTTTANGLAPATDAQCNASSTYSYTYKPLGSNQLAAYDPKAPPPAAVIDVATVDGRPVPYIVREERGTSDRGVYSIAVIADPQKPWSPFGDEQPWNHKLIFIFGGGCLPGHTQGAVPATVLDVFLKFGHMVAASSVATHGTSCNGVLDAEAAMMVKEHIRETYGPVRFTIGDGCSGGAQAQHMVAEMYPGLVDGLRPECDFPDLWSPALFEYYDCALLDRYFVETSPLMWANPVQLGAVLGGAVNPVACLAIRALDASGTGGAVSLWQPDGPGCQADGPWKYSLTNPRGERCTIQDANVNALGRRSSDGAANRPVDHVGVQWGLHALERGEISVEQFVDLNQKVGGFDINYKWTAQRAQADPTAITNLYRTGALVSARNWALVPEISVRADDSYDEHSNVMRDIGRSRLDKAVGNHAGQVFWTDVAGPVGEGLQGTRDLSLAVMDQWLTNIERDTSSAPAQNKVVTNKPDAAVDGCFTYGVALPASACDAVRTPQQLPIMVAGAPAAADILKCQLKPLRMADYTAHGITFTAGQWAVLQATFPSGVCDWSKPGVGQQPPVGTWLTYDGVVGGRPMPPAPASVPFGPKAGAVAVIPVTGGLPWAPLGALLLVVALSIRRSRLHDNMARQPR